MQETMRVTVEEMAAAREARAMAQMTLLGRYPGAVVVCLTMNIAGPVKLNRSILRAFEWGLEQIRAVLAPGALLFTHAIREKTGAEAIFVTEGDAMLIKRRLCALEDGLPLGRLLDIDVLYGRGEKVSRTDIGLPARRCLLCGEAAPVCARSRSHTVDALFGRAMEIIDAHFADEYAVSVGRAAQRALLTEVAISPKPGLVDRLGTGAHDDMDFFTFIDSACALREYFEACARVGLAHIGKASEDCFDALRVPGLLAETAMRRATGGVNTHKGAIFSLGIFCAALGMGYEAGESDVLSALSRCGAMTRAQMDRELRQIAQREATTFGERLYKDTGAGGVRAEAAAGFPSVREAGLPRLRAALRAGLHINEAGLCALAALMARTQDTNAVRRGGEDGARTLMSDAAAIDGEICAALEAGELTAERIRARMDAWDQALTAGNISPGGSADMLALTLLAHFMT